MLSRVLIVLLFWAIIYLPWLGSSGLRSEEGHRVLPAIEMLDSGDYLVPHVGGEPYLRKPPLINWLIAASFKICGARNNWTARFPSTLAVLALALVFVIHGREPLGERGSLGAAFAWMTSLGMIEKGRMIEIEAVYVSLFGIAFLLWLNWWRRERSARLTWIVPWIFLGLAMLAKGPAMLIFFYALLVAILWRTKRVRELLQPAHFAGLLVMLIIFAAWAVPYSAAVHAQRVTQIWSREVMSRLQGEEITRNDWLLNFPLGLAYFLPAGLLLPFVRFAQMPLAERPIARSLAIGAALPFCFILLLPGALPRYILPVLVPVYCLVGRALEDRAFHWQLSLGKFHKRVSPRLVWTLLLLIALGAIIIFPWRSATFQKWHPGYDRIAQPVNAFVPSSETLYALHPNYQPFLFYVRAPVRYANTLEDVPVSAHFLIVAPNFQHEVESSSRWSQRPQFLLRTIGVRGRETLLYRLSGS